MINEVRWERMFPDQLEAAFEARPVVFFPYGICEPHGPQNALGLDALKAHAIACESARFFGGIVAPIDYWHVHELGGYALWAQKYIGEVDRIWTTSVPPWVHFKNVCYHVRTADNIGFHAAIFVTGHYGPNWEDLKTLLSLMQTYTKTRLLGLPDFEANQPGFNYDGKSGGDHAGKVETSLLWALEPACVDMSRLPTDSSKDRHDTQPAENSAVREKSEIAALPPYFAMGQDADQSNRRVGNRMAADEVRWLSERARRLLDEYDDSLDVPGFPRFEDVELFWDTEIRPRLADFKSMSLDFGNGGAVDPKSRWYANWHVPDRS